MRHFPIFLDLRGRRVVVAGAGPTASAKVALLLKTEARISVIGDAPDPRIAAWAGEGRLTLIERPIALGDALCAAMLYAAHDDAVADARAAEIGRAAGALVNIVDNLDASQFITPALVDRDPVTVAIGTEGAAPVLARRIKADVEARLPPSLGALARIGQSRRTAAEATPVGRARRAMWSAFYDDVGPRAFAEGGAAAAEAALDQLIAVAREGERAPAEPVAVGRVDIIGAGPGDPELLTLKSRRAIHEADVVVYDRLVSPEVLELARREARLVEVGKSPYGPSWSQEAINAVLVEAAGDGAVVARLKSGDPGIFGRLDEEMDALDAAGVPFRILPGITAAAAAAAEIQVSLTRRRRNSSVRIMTGHDVDGFAEQDWRALAEPGAVAAVYMGVGAARFLQGRLMIHGAPADLPVAVVENASRAERKTVAATLGALPDALADAGVRGPAILFIGLSPRDAERAAAREMAFDAAPPISRPRPLPQEASR